MPSQLKYPNVVTEGTGGASWTSRDSIKTDNGSPGYHYNSTFGHTNQFSSSTVSSANLLTLSDFGFTIPTGSTIDGVILRVKRKATRTQDPQVISTPEFYYSLQPALSGTNNGTAQSTGGITGTSYVTDSYGSSTNKLGITLTVADINSSNFQIKLTSESTAYFDAEEIDLGGGFFQWFYYGSDIYAEYDFVSVEVFYTEPKIITADPGSFSFSGTAANLAKGYKLVAEAGKFVTIGKGVPLLDVIGTAAIAYSLQKIRAGYTGSAIRVRRSSDSTEQDIGFDADGNLDESALTTFVGAGSGFIRTWYDQSTNGFDASNTTTTSQPRIVNAGTIDKVNGKPAIYFFTGAASYQLSIPGATGVFNSKTHGEIYAVAQSLVTTASNRYLLIFRINTAGSALARFGMWDSFSSSTFGSVGRGLNDSAAFTAASASATHDTTSQYLVTSFASWQSGGVIGVRQNAGSQVTTAFGGTGSSPSTNSNGVFIGTNGGTGRWGGYMQQIVVFNTDQTLNRSTNESLINADWNIYPDASNARLLYNRRLIADATSFSLSGIANTMTYQRVLIAESTALALTGNDATLRRTYTLVAATGTFTYTGATVILLNNELLTAVSMTYAVTSIDATLRRTYVLVAESASMSLTGNAVNLARSYISTIDANTYVLTGVDIAVKRSYILIVDVDAFNITGIDATLRKTYVRVANAGVFTLSSVDADLKLTRILVATGASFTLSGTAATLSYARKLIADSASFALTGSPAELLKTYRLTADSAIFSLTGTIIVTLETELVTVSTLSYVVTGIDIEVKRTYVLTCDASVFQITGVDAQFDLSKRFVTTPAAFDITGFDAGLRATYRIICDAGQFNVTGVDATISRSVYIYTSTGTFQLTGTDVDTRRTFVTQGNAGQFTISGTAATLKRAMIRIVDQGHFALTGNDVTTKRGMRIIATNGAYVVTTNAAELKRAYRLQSDAGQLVFTGQTVNLTRTYRAICDAGDIVLIGSDIQLRKTWLNVITVNGSYAVTGISVSLQKQAVLYAELTSYSFLGNEAQLRKDWVLKAASPPSPLPRGTTYRVFTNEADLFKITKIIADYGEFNVAGIDIDVQRTYRLNVEPVFLIPGE